MESLLNREIYTNQRNSRFILAIISTLLIAIPLSATCGWYIYKTSKIEKGTRMAEPVKAQQNISFYTKYWTCLDGRVWQISQDTMVAACRNNYVDIRYSIDNEATIKGIQLNLYEWKALIETITSIEDFLHTV